MKRESAEVEVCLGFTNVGEERVVVDLRQFLALDQQRRWGNTMHSRQGHELVLEPEPPNHLTNQTLVFRFPEPPREVELRLADREDRVVSVWHLDLVPQLREIRIHYKSRGDNPRLGVAIPVGNAPFTGMPGVGLVVNLGDTVRLRVMNDTPIERDFTVKGLGIQSPPLKSFEKWEQAWQYELRAGTPGRFSFYDSLDPYQSISGTLAIYGPPNQMDNCE
jgi:hypothetical protein